MKFVRFTETNDNEGETWNFWLQLDGNEEQMDRLKKIVDLINEAGFDEQYDLDVTATDESEVDILVKHTSQGYMDYENKVTGKLTLPAFDNNLFDYEDEVDDEAFNWADNNFYKGGVKELFS